MKCRTVVFTEAQVEQINRALGLQQVRTGRTQSFRRGVANLAAQAAAKLLEAAEDKPAPTG